MNTDFNLTFLTGDKSQMLVGASGLFLQCERGIRVFQGSGGCFQGLRGGAWSLKMLQGSMMKYQRPSWSEVLAVLNEV